MIIRKIFILLFCFGCMGNAVISGSIPVEERAALIAFYNSTSGDTWSTTRGWKDEPLAADGFGVRGSEGNWYGIEVSGDHVTAISLPWYTYLKGTLPPEIGNLTYLERLECEGNAALWPSSSGLRGQLPAEMGKLKHLKYINLRCNGFGGEIPGTFGEMSGLEELHVDLNFLRGSIPGEMGKLASLRIFSMGTNQLTSPLPPELGNLSNLETLDLHFNRITGPLPPELGKLKNLRTLFLSMNKLSGSIPSELGNLEKLIRLILSNNSLSGSIPAALGNLANLKYLDLGANQLTGVIPPELGNLANLYTLDLNHNLFTGGIPAELGDLSSLFTLDLGMNQLSGSIPPALGDMGNILDIDLAENKLTGNIPPELGKLLKLKHLNLQKNHLSGELPRQLAQWTQLEFLDVSWNQLVGEIPPLFIRLEKLSVFRVEGNGLFTDNEALRAFLNRINSGWELSQTVAPKGVSAKGVGTSAIRVSWIPILYTQDFGGYLVYYRVASGRNWIYGGMTADKDTASYTVSGLQPGTKYFFILKSRTGWNSLSFNTVTSVSSKEVSASTFKIRPGANQPPFGSFELPGKDGEIKSGSMAVSGWALDDAEVAGVQIYCLVKDSKRYVGDAFFVEGARPDVEEAYPGYPFNRKAGWGYLLLTNVLPDVSYGPFALQAVATDHQGNETILGTRTVFCDNLNSFEPFGAIDTPAQGGPASGSAFINFGWALPSPYNFIPTDGSTIGVWVDGVFQGHPVYNQYREDIAALFPYYNNSKGAGGYFSLDTTSYKNGLHTLSWSVSDEDGNTAGIGSRYFTVQNPDSRQAVGSEDVGGVVPIDILRIPADYSEPVGVIRGYRPDGDPQEVYPDEHHTRNLTIHPLERVEICLAEGGGNLPPLSGAIESPGDQWMGFLEVGGEIKPLPAGSFFDTRQGIFYWQPGAAFLGTYRLVFIKTDAYPPGTKKNLTITITNSAMPAAIEKPAGQ